eukprot:CAMPEP_0206422148 /NCGR_PEP_ID=MMETSP0324_2-20121206/1904_1 /ASSEMBLY_ACC=CAM_ASM_000836 /TAXON_ID=2866 /ORGANISM="Crypthecodinium cohnii, Strain Seligo" /LENGTH=614 /DNA_ID=CAMNT_0053886445 /DNA_START=200 /DNA_END=2041 /DNA_ORIENTATION=+
MAPMEQCLLCLQAHERVLHIRRHGQGTTRCGPHPICLACSVGHANWRCPSAGFGQVACPVCLRGLGTRRRALVEANAQIEHRMVVKRKQPASGPLIAAPPNPKRRKFGKQAPDHSPKPEQPDNFYAFLEVSPKATDGELERAYRRLAKSCHPDKPNGSTVKFQKLLDVFQSMLDPIFRARHDEQLRLWEACHGSQQPTNRTKKNRATEEQSAPNPAEVARRVEAFFKITADMAAKEWADWLREMPSEPWTRDVLEGLLASVQNGDNNRKKTERQKREDDADDVEHPREAAAFVETGLVSQGPPHNRAYYCRLGWENLLFNTTRTRSLEEALGDHAALLRMRLSAQRAHAAGATIEEAVRSSFSYPSTVIHFQWCVSFMGRRRTTPMTTNVEWFLACRKAILERRGRADWWATTVTKLSNSRARLNKIRSDWVERRAFFGEVVAEEIQRRRQWAEALRMVRIRLRGKTSLETCTQLIRRRSGPCLTNGRTSSSSTASTGAASSRSSLSSSSSSSASPPSISDAGALIQHSNTNWGSRAGADCPSGATFATEVASEIIAYLEGNSVVRSPAVHMPWFAGICRRLGIDNHQRLDIIRKMEADTELQSQLRVAFRRAR